MFVFYFGIMADLTPPVALAAFAAAPIARTSGLKIGLQAMRIAIAGFVIPYMAVYAPELMLQGDWTVASVAYIVFKVLLAIVLWGGASIGYLGAHLSWPQRIFAGVAAAMMVAAKPLTDEIGFGLAVLFFAWSFFTMRRAGGSGQRLSPPGRRRGIVNGGRDKGDIASNPPAAILRSGPPTGLPHSQSMPFSSTMPTSRFIMRLLLVVLAAAAVGVASYQRFLARESAQLADASSTRLDFYRSTLVQTLEEFRLLPEVLRMDSRVGELLAAPAEVASIGAVNRYLESVAHDPAIHAVFLIDAEGSRWPPATGVTGCPSSATTTASGPISRPQCGATGALLRVGVTTQEAGFFPAPVRRAERVIGVMVVKIRLDALEDA